MGEKKLVTFNLDEERKSVWENEADERGRSLSGFIRYCGEQEIAGTDESESGGVDHTEELSEIQTKLQGLTATVGSVDDTVSTIHREVSIPDEVKANIPNVVGVLPQEHEGGMTTEEVGELADTSLMRIQQCLNHAEEQTNIVGHDTDEDGTRRFYRKV
jgi:hypothetical protein